MTDANYYGLSPKKPNRKSCLNCVYLQLEDHPYLEDVSNYIWYGEMANCYHKVWERGYSEVLEHVLGDLAAENRKQFNDGSSCFGPITPTQLKDSLREHYGLTRIPTYEDEFIELATFKCRRFYPKKKLKQRTLETCWKDQQADAERMKFWVPVAISLLALAISCLSIWRPWA